MNDTRITPREAFDSAAEKFQRASQQWAAHTRTARQQQQAAADYEFDLKVREATLRLEPEISEGKNAEQRAAMLRLLIENDEDYTNLQSAMASARENAQSSMDSASEASNDMSLYRRLMDFEIALLRNAEVLGNGD